MVLFVVVALLCAVRRRWIVSGVAASLATLTWQPAITIGLAVVITALITIGGGWRAAWKVVLGALFPLVAIVGYFAAQGAVQPLVDGFLGLSLRTETAVKSNFINKLAFIARRVENGYGPSVWILGIGMIGLAGAALWRLAFAKQRKRLRDDPFLVIIIGFVLSVAWTMYDFQGAPDLFILLPFASIGIGVILEVFSRVASRRIVAVASAACVVGFVLFAGFIALNRRERALGWTAARCQEYGIQVVRR